MLSRGISATQESEASQYSHMFARATMAASIIDWVFGAYWRTRNYSHPKTSANNATDSGSDKDHDSSRFLRRLSVAGRPRPLQECAAEMAMQMTTRAHQRAKNSQVEEGCLGITASFRKLHQDLDLCRTRNCTSSTGLLSFGKV